MNNLPFNSLSLYESLLPLLDSTYLQADPSGAMLNFVDFELTVPLL